VGWLLAAGCCWRLYGRHRCLVGGDVGSGGGTRSQPAPPDHGGGYEYCSVRSGDRCGAARRRLPRHPRLLAALEP